MKAKKRFFLMLLISQITVQTSFAQYITADTTLANNYFAKAKIFKDSAQYDSAIVYFEKASNLYQNNSLWFKYLISQTKHGECYQNQWQLDQAIAIIKLAIKNTLLHTNENDTIVADTYFILGLCNVYQSKFDSAVFYWNKTLEIRKNLLGEKNIKTAGVYNALGNVYFYKSEYDKTLEYHLKSLEIRLELLGEKHTDVASSYNNIGAVYEYRSEYDKALEHYFKSLEIFKELLGEKHTLVAKTYDNIGNVYGKKSEYDKAMEYNTKGLEIRLELFGEIDADVATSYMNIGIVYHNKSEYDKALEYYSKSLEIKLELFGEKHTSVADSYNNIGSLYDDKSEFDKALAYHFKSLEIKLELLGEKHISVATSYNNIGSVYYYKSEYDKIYPVKRDSLLNMALEYYFKSLEIKLEVLGEKNTDVASSYMNIGVVYENKSKYDKVNLEERDSLLNKALEYHFKCLEIILELLGKNIFMWQCLTTISGIFMIINRNMIWLWSITKKE